MSVSHSTWPVILMPYNMPPWMCMKQPYFMLSLLILGPSAPGNNIDVYLQPLIEELKELWEVGADTYDASSKENFTMRATLLWTISDFPAYANLSGWSNKGKLACPSCHKDTCSYWLYHSGKHVYMDHRRFLEDDHEFRRDDSFNGKEELRKAPCCLIGSMVLDQLEGLETKFGKFVKDNPELPFNWKKRSIFFELPYWKDNLLCHNLDVMHIEKNVCDTVVGTILNADGKTKDHTKGRLDARDMGIRSELHPIEDELGQISSYPDACFAMPKKEKEIFSEVLKNVKVPDGYASNISRCVQLKPPKILGLKSHDNHILMQQLLPLALRRVLPKHVRSPLMKLCKYFRELCCKVLHARDLIRLECEIAKTLCKLETIFPPSFFDVMMHLLVHLATEAKLGVPVHYRWMYAIERYLCTLKAYVRNRNYPEGSIAEGYLADECLIFLSRYLEDVETKFNRIGRNDDGGSTSNAQLPIFSMQGRPFGKVQVQHLGKETLEKAHQYVLFNCDAVDPFSRQHQDMIKAQNPRLRPRELLRIHNEKFVSWFRNHVKEVQLVDDEQITEELRSLARGPNDVEKRYRGFIINGFRFHTQEIEQKRKSQNSGVHITATTNSFSSANDNNPVAGEVNYYGVLKDIVELEYNGDRKVVLFKCDWVSQGRNQRQDDQGFTLVNLSRLAHRNEPFVLASQVHQVFYTEDPLDKGWHIVIKTTARDNFDMNTKLCVDDVETYLQTETNISQDN